MITPFDYPDLHPLGWPQIQAALPALWLDMLLQYPQATLGRISAQHRNRYEVAISIDDPIRAKPPPPWRQPHFPAHERATTGDWVLLDGEQIVALLPRRSALCRAGAGESYRQQIIAANIDTVFILCGLDADFNLRRIERYLLLTSHSGIMPVIVLTKADTVAKDVVTSAIKTLNEELGIPVCAVNTLETNSVSVLNEWLQPGCTVALVGSSGAGKSSLCNTLLGQTRMKTGSVRQHDARGRHTTTYRALLPLPGGACLIDTPGMRELKPTGEERLSDGGFADIQILAHHCRFNDCHHQHEPGCAVQAALERGELSDKHLQHYLKLQQEIMAAHHRQAEQKQRQQRKYR